MKVYSNVEHTITVRKGIMGMGKTTEFSFVPGIPTEVPDNIASAYYRANRSKYSLGDAETPTVDENLIDETQSLVFDPVEWLEANIPITEDKLEVLSKEKLQVMAESLNIKLHPSTGAKKIIEKILEATK